MTAVGYTQTSVYVPAQNSHGVWNSLLDAWTETEAERQSNKLGETNQAYSDANGDRASANVKLNDCSIALLESKFTTTAGVAAKGTFQCDLDALIDLYAIRNGFFEANRVSQLAANQEYYDAKVLHDAGKVNMQAYQSRANECDSACAGYIVAKGHHNSVEAEYYAECTEFIALLTAATTLLTAIEGWSE